MKQEPVLYGMTFTSEVIHRFITLVEKEMTPYLPEVSLNLKWKKEGEPVTVKEVGSHIHRTFSLGDSQGTKDELARYLRKNPIHHISKGEWLVSIHGSEILMLQILEILDQKILKQFTLPKDGHNLKEGWAYM
jgi:hypothetical protein